MKNQKSLPMFLSLTLCKKVEINFRLNGGGFTLEQGLETSAVTLETNCVQFMNGIQFFAFSTVFWPVLS